MNYLGLWVSRATLLFPKIFANPDLVAANEAFLYWKRTKIKNDRHDSREKRNAVKKSVNSIKDVSQKCPKDNFVKLRNNEERGDAGNGSAPPRQCEEKNQYDEINEQPLHMM